MKKVIIFIIVNTFFTIAHSQTAPYEFLDSLSTQISNLQSEANGQTYEEGNDKYELTFAEENFKILISNRLANNAVYKKKGDIEILEFTENIDLTKAISFKGFYNNNKISGFRMLFPEGSIKTQVFENGHLKETKTINYIDFFSNKNNSSQGISSMNTWKLFNTLAYLSNALKSEKVPFDYNIEELDKEWKEVIDISEIDYFKKFVTKYKGTLYEAQALRMVQIKEEKGEKEFMSFVYFDGFEIGLTLEELIKKYPHYKKHSKSKNKFNNDWSFSIVPDDRHYAWLFVKKDIVIGYTGTINYISDSNERLKKVEEIINLLSNKFNFEPIKEINKEYGYHSYTWEKNKKKIYLTWYPSSYGDIAIGSLIGL